MITNFNMIVLLFIDMRLIMKICAIISYMFLFYSQP